MRGRKVPAMATISASAANFVAPHALHADPGFSFDWVEHRPFAEAAYKAEAIKYAHEHCKAADEVPKLDFDDNNFTDEDKQMMKAAAGDESRVEVVFE